MSIRFKEAVNNCIVSKELIKYIPQKCKCGAEIILSDSLKTARCSNKNCVYSVISRVENINNKLDIGILDSDIEKIVTKLKITTPYQIMMLADAADNQILSEVDVHNLTGITDNIRKIKNQQYYLYEVVELLGIDTIDVVAKAVFDGFDNIDEAYDELYRGQVAFINERLGLFNPESSTLGVEIYSQLDQVMEELLFAETQFNVKRYSSDRINIAFSDNIIPFFNRAEYVEYINGISKYKFNLRTTISNSTDILIRNSGDNNNKTRAARIINDRYVAEEMNSGRLSLSQINKKIAGELKPCGCKIYICSSDELIDRLEDLKEH